MDEAKVYDGWDKPGLCFAALLASEHAAPDEVRYRKPVEEITTRLLTRASTKQLAEIRQFAERCGISA